MNQIEHIQKTVYKILVEFDRVCSEIGVKYSLEGGTLLGAVKYHGFVPWDDDIDVIMLRKDYDLFLSKAPSLLHNCFYLQNYHIVPTFPLSYSKLCIENTEIYDYMYSDIPGMRHGLFIDIFPIDNCKDDKIVFQRRVIGLLTSSRAKKQNLPCGGGWKSIVRSIISVLPLETINRLIDYYCTLYNEENTDFRYEICNATEKFKPLRASLYNEYMKIQFLDGEFWAVRDYDYFLRNRFGNNYRDELPPEKDRKISHFHKIMIDGIRYEDK